MTHLSVIKVSALGNGISDVSLSNGAIVRVPSFVGQEVPIVSNQMSNAPSNTAYGNCGYSEMYIMSNSNSSGIYGWTGFDVYSWVIGSAYYFQWGARVENTTFNRNAWFDWEDPINSTSWFTLFYLIDGAGDYAAYAVGLYPSSTGYVFGTNGVCSSAGARSYTEVY